MKKGLKQLVKGCKIIFGYGIMAVTFAGGLTFFGFLAAVILGGEAAAVICQIISQKVFPIIIYATTGLILLGLVAMYLSGEKALTPDADNEDLPAETGDK